MSARAHSTLTLLYVVIGFCMWTSSAIIVDNSTACDYFATRTTINSTHDECDCDSDFTGNGTSCSLQAQLDCTSNVAQDGFAFKVYLNQTYIDHKGISPSSLRLLNDSCNNVTIEGGYYVLQSPEYDECGSVKSNSSNQIIYSNAVLSNGGGISSGDVLRLDFTCFVSAFLSISLSNNNGTAIQISANLAGTQSIVFPIQGGTGSVTATMFLYQDANYNLPYNGVPVLSTDETLYVKVALDTVLNGVYIVLKQCWATPDAAGDSSERFDIIEQPGCLKNSVTNGLMTSNGIEEEARFQLQVFTFLPSNVVYIHCEVELCTTSGGGTCQPTCPARRKRRDVFGSVQILRSSLIIKSSHSIAKPYETPGSDNRGTEEKTTDNAMLLGILIGLLVLLIIVITAVSFYLYTRRHKST